MNFIFTFIFLFSLSHLVALPNIQETHENFCIVTIPKSGTHLIDNVVKKLYNKGKLFPDNGAGINFERKPFKDLNEWFSMCEMQNLIPIAHTNYAIDILEFAKQVDYKIILHVRDLRDICISQVYWRHHELKAILGENSSFDERLSYVISMDCWNEEYQFASMKQYFDHAHILLNDDVFITRFEDLVGAKGGGDDKLQRESVVKLCQYLGYSIELKQIKSVCDNLFGQTMTFRNGQIGSWKKMFNQEHKALFKEKMGDLLIYFGYEEDFDW